MIKKEKKYGFATISKKVWTFFTDAMVLLLMCLLIGGIGIPILSNIPVYKEAEKEVSTKVEAIYKLEEDANLIDFIDLDNKKVNDPIARDAMFTKYVYRQIALSYEIDSNKDFNKNNIKIDEYKYDLASFENDYLIYFYKSYIPNHPNEGFVSYQDSGMNYYHTEIYKKFCENQDLFVFNNEDYPYLKSNYGYDLYRYVIKNEADYASGKNVYLALNNYFNKVMDNSLTMFNEYKPFKELYKVYTHNYEILVNSSILLQFISYSVAFIISLVIVPLCLRRNRTIGNLLNKTELFDVKEEKITWHMILRKKLVEFFAFYWINLIVSFFTIGTVGLAKDIFSIGSLNFPLFNFMFLSMLLVTVSAVIAISRQDKRSLSELASGTIYLSYNFERVFEDLDNSQIDTISK